KSIRKREPKKLSKLLKQNHNRAAAMESSQGHGDGEAKRETLAVNTGDPPQHCIHCVFLVTFVICFTHRVVKAVGLQFLQGFIRHLNQCFFLLCGDSRCSLCPEKWLWWMGRCYFFSVGLQENRQWNESAEFCRQHNSSLVVIEDSAALTLQRTPGLYAGHLREAAMGGWSWGQESHQLLGERKSNC
uniref:C-type lectin domain-containing protein n=1 Tax=Pundamilia nyererei TaxID=303518 RepID=A0A3B4FFW2_9CICH